MQVWSGARRGDIPAAAPHIRPLRWSCYRTASNGCCFSVCPLRDRRLLLSFMAGAPHRFLRLVLLAAYAVTVCPGGAAWIVCSNANASEIFSAIAGCCACCEAESASLPVGSCDGSGDDALVRGDTCTGCNDSPISIPEQSQASSVTLVPLTLLPCVLPGTGVELSLAQVEIPDRSADGPGRLTEHQSLASIILLC